MFNLDAYTNFEVSRCTRYEALQNADNGVVRYT